MAAVYNMQIYHFCSSEGDLSIAGIIPTARAKISVNLEKIKVS